MNAKCIEAAVKGLPPLPPVVAKIVEETEKDDISIAQVEHLLSADQALVAKALRIVNSSYYGLAGQVRSLSQAIVILGLQQVRNLVLGLSSMTLLQPRNLADAGRVQRLWRESFGTAVGARVIGKSRGMAELQIDLLFVGGLLHRMGKLFLLVYFADKLREIDTLQEKLGMGRIEAEREVLGMSHREINRRLAEQWRLPANLVDLISCEDAEAANQDGDCFHIVEAASLACELTADGSHRELPINHEIIRWVGFDESEWAWFMREVDMRVEAMFEYAGLAAA